MLSDYLGVNELVKEVHQLHVQYRPDVYVKSESPLNQMYFEQLLNDAKTTIWVVENQLNELVAYCIVKIMKSAGLSILKPVSYAFIDDFCVSQTYHKQGIGKKLFEQVKEDAKHQGATSLQLVVWEFNRDALLFYEALGMQVRNRRLEISLS